MVVIRLSRTGAKKSPFYHIVVKDSRTPRDGRYIERVGYFNPVARGGEVRLNLDAERFGYWLSQGAQTSDRVAALWKQWQKSPQEVPVSKAEKLAKERAAAPAITAKPAAEKKAKATAKKDEPAAKKAEAQAEPAAKATDAKAEASAEAKTEAKAEPAAKADDKSAE